MKRVKAHLHLPRLKAGQDDCISVAPAIHVRGGGTEYFGTVTLTNVTFRVHQSGRLRTLDKQQRNVHAWVVGDLVAATPSQQFPFTEKWSKAIYNPYLYETFVDKTTGEALDSVTAAYMVGKHVFYLREQ